MISSRLEVFVGCGWVNVYYCYGVAVLPARVLEVQG
jgi:hypothetical protein